MEINCFPFIYSKSLYVFIDNDMISCIKVDSLCGKYIFDKTKNLSALITNWETNMEEAYPQYFNVHNFRRQI